MKRVQLQLPEGVVAWIDRHAEGVESRASFVRRTLVAVMRQEGEQARPWGPLGHGATTPDPPQT